MYVCLQADEQVGRMPVIIIDEIGKMEMFSDTFIRTVDKLLANSQLTILATIPEKKTIPFVEKIREGNHTKLFIVS